VDAVLRVLDSLQEFLDSHLVVPFEDLSLYRVWNILSANSHEQFATNRTYNLIILVRLSFGLLCEQYNTQPTSLK
jgi:hypothetical protein